jgi:hypothetical protein
VKCIEPYSKEYQKGALDSMGVERAPFLLGELSGILNRFATATPHSPPESFPDNEHTGPVGQRPSA